MYLENIFFNFYFLNKDFSFTIMNFYTKFLPGVENILTQGSVSQNFDLGFCYFFIM